MTQFRHVSGQPQQQLDVSRTKDGRPIFHVFVELQHSTTTLVRIHQCPQLTAVPGKTFPGLGGVTTAAAAEQSASVFFGHVVKLPCDQQQHKQLEPDRTEEGPPKPGSDAVRVHHPPYEFNIGGRSGHHGIHVHLRHADSAIGVNAAQDPTCVGVYARQRRGGQALHRQLIRACGNVDVLENGKHAQLSATQGYFIDTTKIIVAPNAGQRGDRQRVPENQSNQSNRKKGEY